MEREEAELKRDKARWRVRRRTAIVCTIYFIALSLFYAGIGLFVSHDTAKTMAEFNSITVTILSVLGGIIGAYFGTAAWDDISKR